jgi:hypothetical protein
VIPFKMMPKTLQQNMALFTKSFWFAPADLALERLQSRLQPFYLPMWLVDSQVQALWQAEVGFDYETISHRDQFDENSSGWQSQQVSETHVRWEPRVGRLHRTYHNLVAPALAAQPQLLARLGDYDLATRQPYQPALLQNAFVRLPDRSPADAWPETLPAFQRAAAAECQQAASAAHFRDFRWQAQYEQQAWTLLLLPLYITYYLDDEERPQPVLLHGQTGWLSAPRRASMKRAQRAALLIGGIALAIFVLSLLVGLAGFLLPPLLLVGAVGVAVALGVGLLAVIPPLLAWQANRSNQGN